MNQEPAGKPWWKFGYVWLVISGPALVVVAALVTAWIAAHRPDAVLAEHREARPATASSSGPVNPSLLPALQGRNHAATPSVAR